MSEIFSYDVVEESDGITMSERRHSTKIEIPLGPYDDCDWLVIKREDDKIRIDINDALLFSRRLEQP